MEKVLDLYHLPYDPEAPLVCMDELPKQLIAETRVPIPSMPGRPRRIDYEYERQGTANVFMFVEPLRGRRWARVTSRRTQVDWAHAIRELLDETFPDVPVVRLVLDNLNVHCLGSLYEAFPPKEARRLAARLELHFTPIHGSWLNIAEIELKALAVQCLDRRIPDLEMLCREVAAWERARNTATVKVDWQFASEDARVKLKKLYPETVLRVPAMG